MGKRKGREGRFVLVLVAIQVVLVLLALEITVRVLAGRNRTMRTLTYNATFSGDWATKGSVEELLTATSFGYQPFYPVAGFRLNSKGFRTREYSQRKPKGTYRICVFGDSFAFASGGVPYPKMWPTLLEQDLRKAVSRDIEVINLGFMAVGPSFEFRLWQLEGSKLDADLVVVAFFVGNDFVDGSRSSVSGSPLAEKMSNHSYLVRVVRNWLRFRESKAGDAAAVRRIEELAGRQIQTGEHGLAPGGTAEELKAGPVAGYRYDGETDKFASITYNRMVTDRLRIVQNRNREYFERLFSPVADILLDFREAVRSAGADFLLVMIPDDYQVDPQVFQDAVDYDRRHSTVDYDAELPQARLREFCEANDVDYLDLLPAFRGKNESVRLYRPRDSHWNLAGNALAAELIAEKFRTDFAAQVQGGDGATHQ